VNSGVFEYKVVPAPMKGIKAKGVKTPEARFALGVEQAINALAAEGWEYQRSDVLPSTERVGLTGSETHWRTLLVFRRAIAEAEETTSEVAPARVEPVLTKAPAVTSAVPEGDGVAEASSEAEKQTEFEEGNEETRPA
jgi:hypothetical protein